jgi:superfamily II DNA or RNA helicase
MTMELRDYQLDLVARTREALRRNQGVVMQAPTGAGKTAMNVHMMARAAERQNRSVFIVHQRELLNQTSTALWQQRLEHGQIVSGKRHSKMLTQVASVQTLVRRLDQYEEPGLIVIDEAHRAAAKTYRKVLDHWPNAKVIGLTATPERTDGKGLGDLFGEIVEGPPVRELISDGWLCDYDIYAPPPVADTGKVKERGGDYDQGQAGAVMDKPHITGDAIGHYRKLAYGRRCVVMCCTIDHAEHVRDEYLAAGIPAESLDGSMTDPERDAALARFWRGETWVITNVQLLIEGVDIPAIECVQWLRPTQSLIVWLQGCGRGLRAADGKDRLLILDHVANALRHGLPCDERQWSLEGRTKKQRKADQEAAEVMTQQCGACYHIFRPGPDHCPRCGASVEKKERPRLEVVDGELHKMDMEKVRAEQDKERRRQIGRARTLEQLVAVGLERGVKNPAGWAAFTHAGRENRKPSGDEFGQAKKIERDLRASKEATT